MVVYSSLVLAILLIFTITALSNMALMVRLRQVSNEVDYSRLSILIPARNESAVIGRTVRHLLNQSDQKFELLLLDDGSTDGTAEIALQAADGDKRLRIIKGEPLPVGWLGKNWACHQLSKQVKPSSQLLLFADADVTWGKGSLNALLTEFYDSNAHLLSVWPSQETVTWGEKLVVPLMKFVILSYLPLLGVHYLPFPAFAAANGQCMLFRRHIYEHVGGHATARNQIVEDVYLARATKIFGFNLRLVDGGGLIGCRMYTGWPEIENGFGKNILAGHGGSVPFLIFSTVFHWMVFVVPLLAFAFTGNVLLGGLALLAMTLRFIADLFVGVRPSLALMQSLLMPASVVLMTKVTVRALKWHWGDGPEWKGRRLSISD